MQKLMQKQQGFTLIELVVVIIILGILAVTAAPKFINLQGDARVSALQGLKGAIQGANTLVYSKAALSGKEQATGATVTLSGSEGDSTNIDVTTDYGYLTATLDNFKKAVELSVSAGTDPAATSITTDWIFDATTGTFWQAGAPSTCKFTYTAATATATPVFSPIPEPSDC